MEGYYDGQCMLVSAVKKRSPWTHLALAYSGAGKGQCQCCDMFKNNDLYYLKLQQRFTVVYNLQKGLQLIQMLTSIFPENKESTTEYKGPIRG